MNREDAATHKVTHWKSARRLPLKISYDLVLEPDLCAPTAVSKLSFLRHPFYPLPLPISFTLPLLCLFITSHTLQFYLLFLSLSPCKGINHVERYSWIHTVYVCSTWSADSHVHSIAIVQCRDNKDATTAQPSKLTPVRIKHSPSLQFGRIIVLELPLLLLVADVTLLHEKLLLIGADC